jgi:hypothetical protein
MQPQPAGIGPPLRHLSGAFDEDLGCGGEEEGQGWAALEASLPPVGNPVNSKERRLVQWNRTGAGKA